MIAALALEVETRVVRRGLMPVNFANPNAIVQHADGRRTGVSDNRSPWSVALAQ